jgi:histidinol-phosphatase
VNGESLAALLEFAVEVAWRAGRVTLAHFQTGVASETKADASPVTAADRAAERLARELIGTRFPRDGVLGEEDGESRAGAPRRWIIDPIDGTRSFLRGVPLYGVLLALEDAGEVRLGVLHFPALGETVAAATGQGCWWDGRRARVSAIGRLEEAAVLITDGEAPAAARRGAGWARLRERAGLVRTWGDAYGYALVATGRAEAMMDPVMALWDAAPLWPIVTEAGGVITGWDGEPAPDAGHVVATNAVLAEEVRGFLRRDPG